MENPLFSIGSSFDGTTAAQTGKPGKPGEMGRPGKPWIRQVFARSGEMLLGCLLFVLVFHLLPDAAEKGRAANFQCHLAPQATPPVWSIELHDQLIAHVQQRCNLKFKGLLRLGAPTQVPAASSTATQANGFTIPRVIPARACNNDARTRCFADLLHPPGELEFPDAPQKAP